MIQKKKKTNAVKKILAANSAIRQKLLTLRKMCKSAINARKIISFLKEGVLKSAPKGLLKIPLIKSVKESPFAISKIAGNVVIPVHAKLVEMGILKMEINVLKNVPKVIELIELPGLVLNLLYLLGIGYILQDLLAKIIAELLCKKIGIVHVPQIAFIMEIAARILIIIVMRFYSGEKKEIN